MQTHMHCRAMPSLPRPPEWRPFRGPIQPPRGSENERWTNPLRGSHDFGRGSDFAGWVGDKHPRLPLAGQLNRETMTWRHVALFVSQRSCQ